MTKLDTYCLRLKDFDENICTSWQEIQNDTDFCDVTLACEDKQVNAHKIILSSCSPVLRTILKQKTNQQPLIYLRGVKYADLLHLLGFIYQGEVRIAAEDLDSFMTVAEDLKIKGLYEENTNVENCVAKERSYDEIKATPKRIPYQQTNFLEDFSGSRLINEIVKNEVKINSDIINNNTDKKYLEISFFSKLIFKKKCLLREIFLGFTCEIKLLIANLNKA